MYRRYHYVRWRWYSKLDLKEFAEKLSHKYEVKTLPDFGYDLELALMKDARDRFMVKSDTLVAFLSQFRVVITQKKPAPFTSRDVELRKILLENYPYNRPTFLPMHVSDEPEFETVDDEG
jgi:hypothetical protein